MTDHKAIKDTKGGKYADNAEFAEEVLAKNVKQMAQNNPRDSARRQ